MCDHVVALKSRGDQLRLSRVRQQVPGELFDQKAVVGLVVIEGLDHPVPPQPQMPTPIDGESIRVRIPRRVQPVERQTFPKVRALHQPIHQPLIRLRPIILHKRLHLLRRRWQARQVQRHPPNQHRTIRLWRWLHPLLHQALPHHHIDRMPSLRIHLRTCWRNEGPVPCIRGSTLDPRLDLLLLSRRQLQVRIRWWHQVVFIVSDQPIPHLALVHITWLDRKDTIPLLDRFLPHIEPQVGFAMLFIKAVTGKAVLREDRANVAIVIRHRGQCRQRDQHRESEG